MNWDDAQKWVDAANEGKGPEYSEPRWSWDCGFKLDYDGGLLRVSSRLYPVSENIFDGSVSFCIGDDTIFNREFSGKHIDNIKEEVEKYVRAVTGNIKQLCVTNMSAFINAREEF